MLSTSFSKFFLAHLISFCPSPSVRTRKSVLRWLYLTDNSVNISNGIYFVDIKTLNCVAKNRLAGL